jgi:prophage tail gpP-like protein
MALWDQDNPELESIKIRVHPPALSPGSAAVLKQILTTPHAQLAPLLGPGLQFGLSGGTTQVKTTVVVARATPPQPTFGQGIDFGKFLEYEYAEDFLTPSDSWAFSLDTDELTELDFAALVPGARCEVSIDGNPQSTGYIRKTRIRTGASGSVIHIEGRDWLSPVVDSHIDPNTKFTKSMNLGQMLDTIFSPFGVNVQFTQDDTSNLNAITGAIYGVPTTKKGKPLKSFLLHTLKPYPQEGAFAFASRVTQRFGLWIWPMADGKTIMVGQPNFTAPARYAIHHKLDASSLGNNVEDGDVSRSDEEMPAVIFGAGSGGGAEFPHARLKGVIINPLVQVPTPLLAKILAPYPGLRPTIPSITSQAVDAGLISNDTLRPLYLYDSESKTQEQLDAFLRRELSLRIRKSLHARYTVLGHKINGQPLAVNTTIDVDDDRGRLHMPMWILGRHFSKSASAGTRTTLDLIRPNSLVF